MANYVACTLILGGRLPYTLREVKNLTAEADEASRRAKKYVSKRILVNYQRQVVDEVRATKAYSN